MRKGGDKRGRGGKKGLGRTGSGSGNLGSSSSFDTPPLVATPGRWEPSHRAQSSTQEITIKNIKGILNRMTDKRFDELTADLIGLMGEPDDETLQRIIKLIFDKALEEVKFCKMYAELCRRLSVKLTPEATDGQKQVNMFKRLLLTRCQTEFESSCKGSKTELPANFEELSAEEKLDVADKNTKAKKAMLGNITFIGELHKIHMLPERIMHECIKSLLGDIKNPSYDDIESLGRLMTSVGPSLDHPQAKAYMDLYFVRIKEMSQNKNLPSRIRFMLEAVMELRQNKWVVKRENAVLNTTKDPSKESSSTTSSGPYVSSAPQPGLTIRSTGRSMSGTPKGLHASSSRDKNVASGDWEVVPSKKRGGLPRVNSSQAEEPRRPVGGLGRTASIDRSDDRPRSRSNSNNFEQPERPRKNSGGAYDRLASTTLSEEEFDTRLEEIISEYFSSPDVEEAISCINELNNQNNPEIVTKTVSMGLDNRSDKSTDLVIKLFNSLSEENVFNTNDYVKGFESLVAAMEDILLDSPKAPEVIARIMAEAMVQGYLPVKFLVNSLEPLQSVQGEESESIQAAQFAAEVLKAIAAASSYPQLREMLAKTSFDIKPLLPEGKQTDADFLTLVEEKELQLAFPEEVYGKKFREMLSGSIKDFVFWLENDVLQEAFEDTLFLRHLIASLLDEGDKQKEMKKMEWIQKRTPILRWISDAIDSDVNAKKNIVSEVHNFCATKNLPKGMIEELFNYFEPILGGKAFVKWAEDKEDSTPMKQEALKQTQTFLTRITASLEPDEEEDEDEED